MAEPSRFLEFTRRLEALGARYMVTGSVAAIAYSAPRFTQDIDLVVALDRAQIARLPEVFPEAEFYVPPPEAIAAEAAREQRGHFNLIHHDTGFKADIYLAGRDPLHAWALSRAKRLDLGGETLVVAPPEYVIVRKLEFFREGRARESGSEKHLSDIRAMLAVSGDAIDGAELERLIAERGLQEPWTIVRERCG
jgi:hypothetical protein